MDEIIAAIELIRFKELLCDTCYGRQGGWGGAAMTSWTCKFCNGHQMSGSTNHGSVCNGCAIKRGLCEHCGMNPHMYQSQESIDKINAQQAERWKKK